MGRVVEKTAKTIEEALAAALADLGASRDQVEYEVLEQPSRGFLGILGGKPARIRVEVKDAPQSAEPQAEVKESSAVAEAPAETAKSVAPEPAPVQQAPEETAASVQEVSQSASSPEAAIERAQTFLRDVFAAMQMEVTLQREQEEGACLFRLVGDRLGILIGKHGQTLDALQYLANLAANRGISDDRVRIILDVEDYRSRREDTLRQLAQRLADKACRLHEDIKLEPMNRHERKIIHMTLQDNRRVTTASAGEEPYRYIVISPKRQGRRERFSRSHTEE